MSAQLPDSEKMTDYPNPKLNSRNRGKTICKIYIKLFSYKLAINVIVISECVLTRAHSFIISITFPSVLEYLNMALLKTPS